MRKLILLFILPLFFISCSDNDDSNIPDFQQSFLPIDDVVLPNVFILNQTNAIRVSFTLPNACFSSPTSFFGQEGGNSTLVAITAIEHLNTNCAQVTSEQELVIPILVTETRDYTFRFWKGQDANGEDIFEVISIPVRFE